MVKGVTYLAVVATFICCLFAFPQTVYAAKTPLVMGVYPRVDVKVNYQLFLPIALYLTKKLNREVRLDASADFKRFWQGVKNKKFDIVHYNQYHYIISQKKFGYRVILKNEEFGSPKIAGGIAVRRDSGIRSVADLRGKKIIFGGSKKAMMGYIVPRYLLMQEGLNKGDYIESFVSSTPNAVIAAYHKKGDAAGTDVVILNSGNVNQQINTKELRILVKSEPIAQLPWAVKGSMKLGLAKRIQKHMLALNQSDYGKSILRSAKLTGISIAHDREFNPHRDITKLVFGKKMQPSYRR